MDNVLVDSLQSDEKGKYFLELKELNKVYTISFSKPYFITAKIQVVTNIPPSLYSGKDNYYDGFQPGVILVGAYAGIDYKIFEEPVKYFKFSSITGRMDQDQAKMVNLDQRMEAFNQQMGSALQKNPDPVEKVAEKPIEKKGTTVNDLLQSADSALIAGKLEEARRLYEKALAKLPGDQNILSKLSAIDEQEKLDFGNKTKEVEALIAKGDSALVVNDIESARKIYQAALSVLPGDKAALQRFEIADEGIVGRRNLTQESLNLLNMAEAAFKKGDLVDAHYYLTKAYKELPTDKVIMTKLQVVEDQLKLQLNTATKQAYYDAMVAGDSLFLDKKFAAAKRMYEAALRELPGDGTALKRMNEVDEAIKFENTQIAEGKAREMLLKADSLAAQKMLDEARRLYEAAYKMLPEDKSILVKIEAIDEQMKIEKEQFKKRKFEELVMQADQMILQKKYGEAKRLYEAALRLLPDDKQTLEKLKVADEGYEIVKKEAYEKLIKQADELISQKKYAEAKRLYEAALELLPNDKLVLDKIHFVDDSINYSAYKNQQIVPSDSQKTSANDRIVDAVKNAVQTPDTFLENNINSKEIAMVVEVLDRERIKHIDSYPVMKSISETKKNEQENLKVKLEEEFKLVYTASQVQREIKKKEFIEQKGNIVSNTETKPLIKRNVESSTFKTIYTISVIEAGKTTTYQKIEYFMLDTTYFKNDEEIDEQEFQKLTQNL